MKRTCAERFLLRATAVALVLVAVAKDRMSAAEPAGEVQTPNAQALTLFEPWFSRTGSTESTWKYRLHLTTATATTFVLNLRIPDGMQVEAVGNGGVAVTTSRSEPFTEIRITTSMNAEIQLVLTGPSAELQHGPKVQHEWHVDGSSQTQTLSVSAPERRYDPSLVRLALGLGTAFLHDDWVDFRVSEDGEYLRVHNDSKMRPMATVGALFGKPGGPAFLLSFGFAQESPQALDSVMFGLTWDVNKYLSIGGGCAVNFGTELAPGFIRAADAAIEANPEKYARFANPEDDYARYDGFPMTAEGQMIFPGSPFAESTNKSWFVGAFVPLDFREWFTSRIGNP